ncbi:hypothetical protein LTR17_023652 [Elasticomyces elasticus]|nr:hypothetical protein LTR17_023652 [Elasticomyces elasticus]
MDGLEAELESKELDNTNIHELAQSTTPPGAELSNDAAVYEAEDTARPAELSNDAAHHEAEDAARLRS